MFSEVAIKVEALCKCYHIYGTPRDRLKQFVMPRAQHLLSVSPRNYYREFWALKDVSFEVRKGETVGIVGCNGSGKSTLLQIICGTLAQTSGSVETNGRIAALLELGSGFNPEFTGRENVYMNGAVFGLSTEEIDARFDTIVTFAEIGEFIDQAVRTYSSGMVVRLAFAVAVSVDPKLLIVDEALSVGDESFQRKCFSRIEALKNNGATILFVSHSANAVVELCDRAILLDAGEMIIAGTPKKVIGGYQQLIYAPEDKRVAIRDVLRISQHQNVIAEDVESSFMNPSQEVPLSRQSAPEWFDQDLRSKSTVDYESRGAYIDGSPHIETLDGRDVNNLNRGKTYRYKYKVRFTEAAHNVRFGMMIKSISGIELGGSVSAPTPGDGISDVAPGTVVTVCFMFVCNLNPGAYFLNAGVTGTCDGQDTYLHRKLDFCMFRVISESGATSTALVDFGCVAELLFDEAAIQ